MNIVCISALNIRHKGENSTSLKVFRLIEELIYRRDSSDIDISIVSLMEYELTPYIGCGECYKIDKCYIDNDFNKVYIPCYAKLMLCLLSLLTMLQYPRSFQCFLKK